MTEQQLLPVIQADRQLFSALRDTEGWYATDEEIKRGDWDGDGAMQAIASHRLTTSPHQEEVGQREALDKKLGDLFPEWEYDQRWMIAGELSAALAQEAEAGR